MLKYLGIGWLPDIPARDLTEEEVKKYGGEKLLVKSGCYSPLLPPPNIHDKTVEYLGEKEGEGEPSPKIPNGRTHRSAPTTG